MRSSVLYQNVMLKKIVKHTFFPLYFIWKKWCLWQATKKPKKWADMLYQKKFGHPINWLHPYDLNEKIRWMQFYTDTSFWSVLADKYAAREYVMNKNYGNILVKLYGKWDKAVDIDFDKLPNSFVLKTNHGSGEIIIVKNKNEENLARIRKKMQAYLDTPFGILTVEPHYLKIKPCIIAEELLVQDGGISTSLVDYKFFCFKGIPFACGVFYDRNLEDHKNGVTPYDMEWKKHEEWRNNSILSKCKDIPCPKTFNLMKQACKDLASQFPFVRVDFYEVNGRLYFGEFTFTPSALNGGSFSVERMQEWGNLIDLNMLR